MLASGGFVGPVAGLGGGGWVWLLERGLIRQVTDRVGLGFG